MSATRYAPSVCCLGGGIEPLRGADAGIGGERRKQAFEALMRLRHIYLYLHLDEYPAELATPFAFRTRYVCNFLERTLHELKFDALDFSKISIQGRHRPLASCPIVPEHAALSTVVFDETRYRCLAPEQQHEFYAAMIADGLERCARWHQIPLSSLRSALENFRNGGFRNQWTHQRRLLRPLDVRASLLCSLDPERFLLTLRLERRGEVILERQVMETKPDEIIFGPRFRDVVVEANSVVVQDRFGRTVYSVPCP